jgi:hypothetical protein
MVGLVEDGLGALERIIAKAEERRVDTMIHIAFLEADDLDSTEAHTDLVGIEKLLKTMRRQRSLLAASARSNDGATQDMVSFKAAA